MPFIIRPTITETFLERVRTTPKLVGFQSKAAGKWRETTFREFYDECRLVSFGLMGIGVKPGTAVIILANTRMEWALADMAILGAAGVTVPIYASSTAEDSAYILNHCEARVAFVENAHQLEKISSAGLKLDHLRKIIVMDAYGLSDSAQARENVLTWTALKELGRREEANEPSRFEANLNGAKPEDLITICYTSGTTGTPKGVMLTHDNMMSVIEDVVEVFRKHITSDHEKVMAFLPFSHIIGKAESLAVYSMGYRECYAESLDKLIDNIGEVKPSLMWAVPRIFEKAYARIKLTAESGSAMKEMVFDKALAVGREYHQLKREGKTPSPLSLVEYSLADRLVFKAVRDRFGGNLSFALCGGAPLPREVGEFFQILGICILEGYGLTETSAPVTLNTPENYKLGTVGKPLPDVSIKTLEDGEILVKSRKVFQGYFKDSEATAAALKDGWLHTGDIGFIDSEGYLSITDRKKDIIVTSGGKNIAPQKIENLAKTHRYINQFVVIGDRHNYLTALITLDRPLITQYANENQILFSKYSELIKQPKIGGLIQQIVDELNSKLAGFESIKKFVLLPNEFTVEEGELTPSLKIKRQTIARKYRAEIDSMYSQS